LATDQGENAQDKTVSSQTRSTALITGASGGIGLALAKLLAADGHNLVLVARSEDRLRQIADELSLAHRISANVVAVDLARANAAELVVQALGEKQLTVDLLVNNAGFGAYGPFAENPLDDVLGMIQVNVLALSHLTRLLLPAMLARGSGKILNMASIAAFQPGPLMAVYFATKAYVLSFSEALASEVAGTGVTVTVACPGPIQSGFQERSGMGAAKLIHGKKLVGPEPAAQAALQALKSGKTVVIPGFSNKLLALAARRAPRRLATWVAHRVLRRATDK